MKAILAASIGKITECDRKADLRNHFYTLLYKPQKQWALPPWVPSPASVIHLQKKHKHHQLLFTPRTFEQLWRLKRVMLVLLNLRSHLPGAAETEFKIQLTGTGRERKSRGDQRRSWWNSPATRELLYRIPDGLKGRRTHPWPKESGICRMHHRSNDSDLFHPLSSSAPY